MATGVIDLGEAAADIWKPISGSDWNRWAQSLSSTAFSARDSAGLAFQNSDDAIIDLCLGGSNTSTPHGNIAIMDNPHLGT